jgi:small-conductance mechanosensitive channel
MMRLSFSPSKLISSLWGDSRAFVSKQTPQNEYRPLRRILEEINYKALEKASIAAYFGSRHSMSPSKMKPRAWTDTF